MAQHIISTAVVRVPRAGRQLCGGVCLAAAPHTGTGMRRSFRGRRRPPSNALLGSVRRRRGGWPYSIGGLEAMGGNEGRAARIECNTATRACGG